MGSGRWAGVAGTEHGARSTVPVDAELIPLGTVDPVDGTPPDLRRPVRIGEAIRPLLAEPMRGLDPVRGHVTETAAHGTGSPRGPWAR